MKIISLLSQKGGAGKTVLSVNLAAYANSQGLDVAIADIDAQSSSCVWFDAREEDDISVVSCQPTRLESVSKTAAKENCDLLIIDTSPNSESATLAAARLSDFALVPCRPSLQDIEAIRTTIELVAIAQVQAGIVINAAKNSSIAQDATTAISGLGL
ncbi:MAG: ParA family protein, partial [Symploca sp. SIO3C6]|nr:ParA family protein [Symploca sp. SIO3C6]